MVRQVNLGVGTPNPNITWQKFSRPILAVIAVIAVVLIVLFNQQISKLLELWGIKAASVSSSINLQGTNNTAPDYFLNDYSASVFNPATGAFDTDDTAVKVENNRLMIN
ncbi:MAG: hypothetical protein V1719_02635 [Patescibacteria group bacterium]